MRIGIMLIFLFYVVFASGQTMKKPLEGGIGFGIYTNHNTPKYTSSDLNRILPLALSAEGFTGNKWNISDARLREYSIGISTRIKQSRNFRNEMLFSMNLVGQFQHHSILSASYESLTNEKPINANKTIETYDHTLMLVTAYNDLIMLRPTLGLRRHLNRRLNVRSDMAVSIGTPIINGFDVSFYSGTIERTKIDGQLVSESAWYDPNPTIDSKFIEGDYYLTFSASISFGAEYRVFEHRSLFVSCSGILGKQCHWLEPEQNDFHYSGGEIRLISRF